MREIKVEETLAIAAVAGVAALFGLAALPSSLAPYAAQLSQLNNQVTSVLLVMVFAVGEALTWPRVRIVYQSFLIMVFLIAGIGLAVPAFVALGVVGLVLTMLLVTRVLGWRRAR